MEQRAVCNSLNISDAGEGGNGQNEGLGCDQLHILRSHGGVRVGNTYA